MLSITTANISDKAGACEMIALRPGGFAKLEKALVDGGYNGKPFGDLSVVASFRNAALWRGNLTLLGEKVLAELRKQAKGAGNRNNGGLSSSA